MSERKTSGISGMGVFGLKSTTTQRVLVFTTIDVEDYWWKLEKSLQSGQCESTDLQADWNKYGEDDFTITRYERFYNRKDFNSAREAKRKLWASRMSSPRPVYELDLSNTNIARRKQ